MDWQKGRESDNVVEDDGSGGGGLGGGGMRFGGFHLGFGGIIIVVLIGLIFPGIRPILFGLFLGGGADTVEQSTPAPTHPATSNDPQTHFVRSILGSTEDVWGSYFQAGGQQYERPKLVLFHGRTTSGCGAAEEVDGTVLLSQRPSRLSRSRFLPGDGYALPRPRRFRARLRGCARGRSSRAESARHHAESRRPAHRKAPAGPRCASNCRPTVSPACGATSRRRSSTG